MKALEVTKSRKIMNKYRLWYLLPIIFMTLFGSAMIGRNKSVKMIPKDCEKDIDPTRKLVQWKNKPKIVKSRSFQLS